MGGGGGGHVRAEPPHRIERDQPPFHLPTARVRLTVRDDDARGTRQARVLLVPVRPDTPGIEMDLGGRVAARRDAQRRLRRLCEDDGQEDSGHGTFQQVGSPSVAPCMPSGGRFPTHIPHACPSRYGCVAVARHPESATTTTMLSWDVAWK